VPCVLGIAELHVIARDCLSLDLASIVGCLFTALVLGIGRSLNTADTSGSHMWCVSSHGSSFVAPLCSEVAIGQMQPARAVQLQVHN